MSLPEIAIFKPGKHTTSDGRVITFTEADCRDIVESYDPALAEAPFVIGHPKQTAPAYGWAASLKFENGLLRTTGKQVNTDFAEAFKSGAFKKRSASIYLPDSPGNPRPGHFYLRHVGFLGAEAPAIKGLPDVNFSAPAGDNAFVEFSINENELQTEEPEMGSQTKPEPGKQTPPVDNREVEFAERQRQLDEREQALQAQENKLNGGREANFAERERLLNEREQEIKEREAEAAKEALAARRTETVEFAETLVIGGRIHPKMKNSLVEALLVIDGSDADPVSFSEGGTTVSQSVGEVIRNALKNVAPFVDFAEKSGSDKGEPEEMSAEVLAEKARQYQAEQKKLGRVISITDAVNYVKKEAKK